MQRPYTNTIHLPYSKWSQHRADNGLIYLSHPVTGEVKWLWSRHHDPKTETDYLVNTVTGDRQWVTTENEHLCPLPTDKSANNQSSQNASPSKPQSTNPFTEKRANRKKTATNPTPHSPSQKPKYREIAAPKSLGLSVDEVLMLVPDTGRRYIFNKKTNSSRWLPDTPPDTIGPDSTQKSLFGRAKPSKQSTPDDPNDDIHPQLREKAKAPFLDPEQPSKDNDGAHANQPNRTASPHVPQHNSTNPTSTQPSTDSSYPLPRTRLPSQPNSGSSEHQPTRKPTPAASPHTYSNGTNNADPPSQPPREKDPVANKLNALDTILTNINQMTRGGKYELSKLRRLTSDRKHTSQIQEGLQHLLELEEYLTQQMLKVDAVESEGNQNIRARRKETVKTILGLTDEIEQLRSKLKGLSVSS
ncbi:hypothetical protein BWQ96_01491 [Gracilariopsis chorda]|uniref:BAG domain-containing protein n=1 Tax=Gracilariopsis chorda TaxID=448386 RepID=A0A2V3J2N6_9FLOR|nr:hypothetical protein BWQ96_01491 [Gracilariopsis chorda]|eukprot:PXF48639.1 hypothetical protein BWQ96_01491 [Gracilariopsis chorda]